MKKGLAISLIFIIGASAFFLGFYFGKDFWLVRKPIKITPTIDGIIDEKEWRRAPYYNIPFYLDVDNTIDPNVNKSNVDGWNYLSVAEDDSYYYVALDLCSDRTNNPDGEWISFFLANRLPEIDYSKLAFVTLADYGFEYIYYNVSAGKPFDYQFSSGWFTYTYYDIPILPEVDQMDLIYGESSSTYLDFWNMDDTPFTITSENVTGRTNWMDGEYIDWTFGVNISSKFPEKNITQFLADMNDLKLELVVTADLIADPINNLGNASTFYLAVAEHGGTPPNISDSLGFLSNPNEISFLPNEYVDVFVDLEHTNVNTTTGMFYFTIHGFNEFNTTYPTNYKLFIDKMALRIRTTSIITLIDNSIEAGNYDIAYTFGSSVNCPEPHRMFEFKIAKSEFPVYEEEDVLYLFVAGYGTMSLLGTNYWAYPGSSNDNPFFNPPLSNNNFLKLDMSVV